MAALWNLATAGLLLLLSFTLSQGFSFASTYPLSRHWRRAQSIQSDFKSRETGGAITSMHTAAHLRMSASTAAATVPSWSDLKTKTQSTKTGSALTADAALRKEGKGAPRRENTLRLFGDSSKPKITLFRDHAAWCPYVRGVL
jgi:IS5 family transposase